MCEGVFAKRRTCFLKAHLSYALSLAVIFVALANCPSFGAATNGAIVPKTTAAPSKGRGIPFHGTIASEDKSARTITLEGKKQRTFQVTAETKIHFGNLNGNLNSVKPGADVGGYARELPDGKLILVTLNIKTGTEKPSGVKPPK